MKYISLFLLALGLSVALASTDDDAPPPVCQGKTPAKVVIDSVGLAEPSIRLRNLGGSSQNLSGWKLTGSDSDQGLFFVSPACSNITILDPSRTLILTPKTSCPLPDSIIVAGGVVNLLNAAGTSMSLTRIPQTSDNGSTLYLMGSTYQSLKSNTDLLSLLEGLGTFKTFLSAIKATGLDQKLSLNNDPGYVPPSAPKKPQEIIIPQLPWWYSGPNRVDRSRIAPAPPPSPPPPPPPAGLPSLGPYTILAPDDSAFDVFRKQLGGGLKKMPMDQFLALPELKDIIQYHILPGRFPTADMHNNTMIYSGMGVPIVPFMSGCLTEGYIMISDSCVDKPTPDNYTCQEQVAFDKCYLPFMTSALAAQWSGGFCQWTCQRCQCSAPSTGPPMEDGDGTDSMPCASVVQPDITASNGLIQVISRVLVPPPSFTKENTQAVMANPAMPFEVAAASKP